MKTSLSIGLFLLIIPTLFAQGGIKSNLTVINLAESFSRQQEVPLSRFVDIITYVSLENSPQVKIGGSVYYEVTDEYIIVRQRGEYERHQILLFDRNSGKFIREIGKEGQGPDEFTYHCFIPFNPSKKELYARGAGREILVYDLLGRNKDKINIPDIKDENGNVVRLSTKNIYFENILDDNIFVGNFSNTYGNEKSRVILLSKEGILKIFPNYQALIQPINFIPHINKANANYYSWNNKLYYLEAFCDTLYQVTKSSLVPRYYFDCGKYNVTWTKLADEGVSNLSHYFLITDIDENNNYIFIKVLYEDKNYTGFIEKKTNVVTFCKTNISGISGFKDDINGLMDVVPEDITPNNEMVYIIQPYELFLWLNGKPEIAALVRDKMSWLKDLAIFNDPGFSTAISGQLSITIPSLAAAICKGYTSPIIAICKCRE